MTIQNDIIFGRNPVLEVIQDGKKVDKVLLLKSIRGEFEKEVRKQCKLNDIPLQYVPNNKLDKFTKKNHQGIIAFASLIEYHSLDDVLPHIYEQGKTPFILILDGVSDVRNFGAIARSAEVFGVHAIVIPEKRSARVNHDAIKSSAGAILRIPICREKNLNQTIEMLQEYGCSVFATDLATDYMITDIDFSIPCAVVLGSEGSGVRSNILKTCDLKFKIPQVGHTDSLNVSVAAGVIMYEILKQRQFK